MGIIQTWARNLSFHPHIHYIVPAAALSTDRKRYIKIKNSRFLVHVRPLSRLFKILFRQAIKNTAFYHQIPSDVWQKEWVVHVEAAGYGREIIKYLAPYVYRVVLSNHSIKKIEGREVTFTYEDNETKETKFCTLEVLEFMRRFLQHVLPSGFMKVRRRLNLNRHIAQSAMKISLSKVYNKFFRILGHRKKFVWLCESGFVICSFWGIFSRPQAARHITQIKKYSINIQSPAKSIRFFAMLTVISANNLFIQYANWSS